MTFSEKRVWRLFRDYKKWIAQEHFAIQSRNLSYLEAILKKKDIILNALVAQIRDLPLSIKMRGDFKENFSHIVQNQQKNAALLQDCHHELDVQIKDLDIKGKQLKGLKKAYLSALFHSAGKRVLYHA